MFQTLLDPAYEQTKEAIVATLFRHSGSTDSYGPKYYSQYFSYYDRQLESLQRAIREGSSFDLAAQTHDDLLYIVRTLATTEVMDIKRAYLREAIRPRFQHYDCSPINRSINFALRLWLMIDVGDDDILSSLGKSSQWKDRTGFHTFIGALFPQSSAQLSPRERRIDPSFTAASMVKLCNLRVEWTDNLADHLLLDRQRKTLSVFTYKDFLWGHLQACKSRPTHKDPLPRALLLETITTLNLLFPQGDTATEQLLLQSRDREGQQPRFHYRPPFVCPQRLDMHEFDYWRDRLVELYQEVYLAPADSWRQLWVDRRNPHQWWTFWIAIFVLLLSVVSCAASVIQAYASVKALGMQTGAR